MIPSKFYAKNSVGNALRSSLRTFCLDFQEAEQALTNKLKQEHAASVESYEARLKQSSGPLTTIPKDKVKDEPIDCHNQENRLANHLLEIQIVKDCLEQAQIDLGKR